VQHAIEREKELKLLSREQKLELIRKENPYLQFLKVEDYTSLHLPATKIFTR
jgi:putative endonuclease